MGEKPDVPSGNSKSEIFLTVNVELKSLNAILFPLEIERLSLTTDRV